jgi:hypothetical protein
MLAAKVEEVDKKILAINNNLNIMMTQVQQKEKGSTLLRISKKITKSKYHNVDANKTVKSEPEGISKGH